MILFFDQGAQNGPKWMPHCPPISRQKHEKTLALVCAGSFTNFPHEGFKWGLFRGMVAQSKILQNAIKHMKNIEIASIGVKSMKTKPLGQ